MRSTGMPTCQNGRECLFFPHAFIEFCLPTRGTHGPGRRRLASRSKIRRLPLRLERDGARVRLITRGGYNWASRYPWIVEAARKVRQKQFVLDGEAVVLGVDGVSDFNALHSRKHDDEVQFCAFDILAEDGDDLRMLPLSMRKVNLERLLARRPEGVFINPFELGELGPDLFRAACNIGLEGLVSKRRDRPYEAGRCRYWIKLKNPKHPAMEREL
ncbi:ATP-dependent DNA ligase [Bradyrhizobium sp. 195]|uniref:ATP-dependent DNA ligase n=1 Tax=Bradyrhizobium sp. 195 TaxID=2782662 RepID=UPI003211BFF6